MTIPRATWFSLILTTLAVAICVSACASDPQQSEDGTATSDDAITAQGNWSDYTDGQCVHGAYQFFEKRYGIALTGACAQPGNVGDCENCGACMIWKSSAVEPSSRYFVKYNWGDVMPQTYDMVVYPPRAGIGPGHVAVVDHMDSTRNDAWRSLYVMDSNYLVPLKKASHVHTVSRAPYGIYRLKSLMNKVPAGHLDTADCTTIAGWSQDPSTPKTPISVQVSFDGTNGSSGAEGVKVLAGSDRADLCKPLGSCNHAYAVPTPRGDMDGAPHTVYAYGIDSAGAGDHLLTDAPKKFTCSAPVIPSESVKRHVVNLTSLNAWKLQTFFDMATYDEADVTKVADGADLSAEPSLVQVPGEAEIYVVEGSTRRHVVNAASLAAWRFTATMIKAVSAAQLDALTPGLDWPALPLLIKSTTSSEIYLLDDTVNPEPAPATPVATNPGEAASAPASETAGLPEANGDEVSRDSSIGAASGSSGGCSVNSTAGSAPKNSLWLILSLVGLCLARRRREMNDGSR